MMITKNIIELKAKERGSTSIILVGTHGNEKCGIRALNKIFSQLKIRRGRVFIICGNPEAIKRNKRFIDKDLNRMFKPAKLLSKSDKGSYEYRRMQILKKYLNRADALIDIHASRTRKTKPFIICEKNAMEIVKLLPIRTVVSGFDKLEPGGADYYMNRMNKIGVCVECGYFKSPQSTQMAKDIILAFLKIRGHIISNKTAKRQKQTFIRMRYLYITKTNRFTLSKSFDDFEKINLGQIIGTDGNKKIRSARKSIILFARNGNKIKEEAFLLGEKKNSLT